MVDFLPPRLHEDDLGHGEDAVPLDGEAATSDGDDNEAAAQEASDYEDPDV